MENIEKKLFTYSLFDKSSESFDVLVIGYDDKATIDYYIKSFKDIKNSLDKYYKGEKLEIELKNLQDKIKDSCIYRVAYFDNFKGEFVNEKVMLVDLFDFNLFDESEEKN